MTSFQGNFFIRWYLLIISWINFHHHHMPKGSSFTANAGTKVEVLSKDRSSTGNSGTKLAVLLWINRYSSFPLLSASHFLFSIWTDLKRSEKSPGAPMWRWGDWIWITGPSGLHWNSPQGLNISSIRVFDQIRDHEIPITFRPLRRYIIINFTFRLSGKINYFDQNN